MLSRRGFFAGLVSTLVAAPAIVRAASLMPIRGIVLAWVPGDINAWVPGDINKLILFRREIVREYVRQNLFSPYNENELTSIIRVINGLKTGGEQINIPLVARLKQQAIA